MANMTTASAPGSDAVHASARGTKLVSFFPLRDLLLVRVEYSDSTEDVLDVSDDGSYRSLRGLPPSEAAAEATLAFLDWLEHGIEHTAFVGVEWDLAEAGRVLRGEHEVRCDDCGTGLVRCCDGWAHDPERRGAQQRDRNHVAEPEYGYAYEVRKAIAAHAKEAA